MMPYTPLHLLLFSGFFDCLVMTSGNYTDLPLAIDNDAALHELGRIADFFLIHNREIVNRCDDSLIRVIDGEAGFLRRSRGYVPYPISVKREDNSPVILGIGGEMKNNFCLLKDDMAFISQYIGEIDTLEGEKNLRTSLLNLQELIGVVPEIVAYDAHPDYASSKMAREIDAKAYIAVQHHHAHLASCMADNGLDNDETIGIILDGTGYGTDGNLWGFEILAGDYIGFRRLFHLDYVPLPGGEVSIREPWRTACSYLIHCLGDKGNQYGRRIFKDRDVAIVEQMLKNRFNTPLACGCGRLFDAVSALLEIALENTYEGQAAIELGEAAIRAEKEGSKIGPYSYEIKEGIVYPGKIIAGVVEDKFSGVSVGEISLRFHKTLVHIICDATDMASADTGLKTVALSGGTWHNDYLFRASKEVLRKRGYKVLYHRQAPTNDGCIALGQAMVAHWRWRKAAQNHPYKWGSIICV
jgi:hydrogenase maturation protein HypF